LKNLALPIGLIVAGGCGEKGTDETPDAGVLEYPGPEIEAFFDRNVLATVRLDFDQEFLAAEGYDNWEDLLWDRWYHCGPYTNWVPVRFTYEDADGAHPPLEEVAIRFRGGRDRVDAEGDRNGFKVHFFNLLTDGRRRRFSDLNQLNLLSLESDETVMIQCMGYQMLRDFGVPAPRCNHVRVFIDGEYYGLMENAEERDDGRYLRHNFGGTDGALYAANPGCKHTNNATLQYLGPTYLGNDYEITYKIEQGTEKDADAQLVPMLACADPTTTPDDGDFASCIQEWLDLDKWLRLMAAEVVMPSLEAMSGAGRNFYLYFWPDEAAPHGGRFVAYTWDLDHALVRAGCAPDDCDILSAVPDWHFPNPPPPLVDRLRTVFRAEFCAKVQEFYDTIFDAAHVDLLAGVIGDAMVPGGVYAETDPIVSAEAWIDEVEGLRDHIATDRALTLDPQIALYCP